jgi:hypothetical protein
VVRERARVVAQDRPARRCRRHQRRHTVVMSAVRVVIRQPVNTNDTPTIVH